MKSKVLALAAAAIFSSPLFAQDMTYDAGKTTIGIRAGVNFATINGKDFNGNKLDNNIRTGFHAGLNAELPLGSGAYLQPGVLYSQKGAELKGNNGNDEIHLNYIEVPVNFVYKPVLGTGRMLLGFGPYAGFGLSGKVKSGSTTMDVEFENEVPTNPGNKFYMRGVDAGANLLAGYEFAKNVSFQVNAQLGLTNNYPENNISTNDQTKWKNTNFGASLGYRF